MFIVMGGHCPHWQPAIAVIIVHLFNLFIWSINSLSPISDDYVFMVWFIPLADERGVCR